MIVSHDVAQAVSQASGRKIRPVSRILLMGLAVRQSVYRAVSQSVSQA